MSVPSSEVGKTLCQKTGELGMLQPQCVSDIILMIVSALTRRVLHNRRGNTRCLQRAPDVGCLIDVFQVFRCGEIMLLVSHHWCVSR
jgi:hypothetical protein